MEKFIDMSLNAKKWALFFSITMVLSGLLSMVSKDIVSAIISIALGILMFKFQNALGKAVDNQDLSEFEVACQKQGVYVKTVGILSLIGLVSICLLVFFATIVGGLGLLG